MARYKVSVTFEVEAKDDATDELHAAAIAMVRNDFQAQCSTEGAVSDITREPYATVEWLPDVRPSRPRRSGR